MRFQGSFSTEDLNGMTWFECERFCEFYYKTKREETEALFKLFAFHNLESSRLAEHGTKNDLDKYLNRLRKTNEVKESTIEDQFEGVDFGK